MGTYGPGNFDCDAAMDYVNELVEKQFLAPIREAIQDPHRLEPDEWYGVVVPCMIDILAAIAEERRGLLPEPAEVANWKRTYLKTWDAARTEPWPERRATLDNTFDRLLRIAKEQHKEASS